MSEIMELTVLEIKPEQAPALYVPNGLDAYLDQIRELATEVPDVTTRAGRERIGSLARMVGSSKKAIEEPGRNYLKILKEAVKPAEEELRRFTKECDSIRDKILAPREEWQQAEQAKKDALQQRLAGLRALADVIDDAGNYLPSTDIQARISEAKAVALDDTWQEIATEAGVAKDATLQKLEAAAIVAKQREDQAAELERLRKEAEEKARRDHEEKLKQEAAESARREAEQKAQVEREEAARREAELKAKAEQAERDRIAAQERAEREAREAQDRTAKLAQEARQQAEREKQAAIAEEQRKAKAAEDERLAEEKRVADEAAKRAANELHRKAIGTAVVNALIANASLSREDAITTLVALKDGLIPHTTINY
ncbi:hypothetical protein PRCB_01275 [Pantoea rodasii]|uniref:Uncharacterized protein n=1 Tax=Pantoea rodasii TaxID=1076549 RepID=A0A2M9WID7_9GAMM|nr:hypothetical protein [Pantoea rodasii]ORM64199.1 hypothetical protein HA45_10185 [Pantoea rodasii]PJZ07325.1 hypothetical protein PRCB_01275 [Pantoea rodasii]